MNLGNLVPYGLLPPEELSLGRSLIPAGRLIIARLWRLVAALVRGGGHSSKE